MTLTPRRSLDDLGPDFDEDDRPSNDTTAGSLSEIAETRLSRRGVLAGGMVPAAGFLTTSMVRPDVAVAAPAVGGRGAAARPAHCWASPPSRRARPTAPRSATVVVTEDDGGVIGT